MKITDWKKIKSQYPLGKIIDCKIISVHHYGIFVDIDSDEVKGFITSIDFLKKDRLTLDYPEVDSTVTSIITGHSNDYRNQVWLSLNPKIIESSIDFSTMTFQEYFNTIIS